MKKVVAILIWGVLIFAIGTYLDKVRGMMMGGGDPLVTTVLRFAAGFVLAVLVVLAGRWLKGWTGKRMGPGDLFLAGAVAWALQGGLVLLIGTRPALDIQIHDTMIVIYYVHAVFAIAVLFAMIGLVYFQCPNNAVLGYLHFGVSFAALYVVVWMEYFAPGAHPRRYFDFLTFDEYQLVSRAYYWMALLLLAVQVLFAGNLMGSQFFRRRR